MSNKQHTPEDWLERAKELRELAKHSSNNEMKKIMEEIAEGYERIAEHEKRYSNGKK
jgi:Skp family chaperone for outer membrane proteins